ncbi:MAG: hypothetical protein SGJ27_14715 [Candidatus Melainabacteria bacterium]|nr:hypothetical protein [Candidatus Melainabacteria bacterium]
MTADKDHNPLSNILSTVGNMLIRLSGERDEKSLGTAPALSPAPEYPQMPIPDMDRNTADNSQSRQSQSEIDEQAFWMKRLADITAQFDIELGVAFGQRGEYIHVGKAADSTDGLLNELYSYFSQLATAFNNATSSSKSWRVRITVSDFNRAGKAKQLGNANYHFRLSTSSRQLLVVGKPGKIHFYLAPSAMALNNQDERARERRKLSLRLMTIGKGMGWTVYGLPVTGRDIRSFQKMMFRDLVILSAMDAVAAESGHKFEHVDNIARLSDYRGFRDTLSLSSEPTEDLVRDLLMAQQNAVHKLLNQQEETQASIARDLHDGVLADILMLRRKVSSDVKLDHEQIADILDGLTVSIRDICSGLVPRDLKDWGLETVLQDLVDKLAEQTEADCSFEVEGTIPELPSQVQLHIFRIVQECMNNIKKYADANSMLLNIKAQEQSLIITIKDDGRGFDLSDQRDRTDGGFGLPGIEERVEIIKAFYATRLKIESTRGEGTTVILELMYE